MLKIIFPGLLIAILLFSGCIEQLQEEPELEEESPVDPVVNPVTPRPPRESDISAEGKIIQINYIFTSATYGGFIESIDFEVTNSGEEPIVISVDYLIADFSEPDLDLMVLLDGLGGNIIPVIDILPGETKDFSWQVPKRRLSTGHTYKVRLTINDTISKKELVIINKTQELPCRENC